jgi:hypothetical protein
MIQFVKKFNRPSIIVVVPIVSFVFTVFRCEHVNFI